LINRFPEHASLYQHNLLEFQKKMTALDVEISQLLHPVEGHAIIVSHPSLGYFCSDYHLIQISIECEGKTPLPSDLKQIFSLSKQYPVLCVLTQEQFDNKGAITIAQKLQLPLHSINPNDPDYFENIHTLVNHLLQHP
jgi:zinc transport system substrate-binding protein